MKEIERVPSTRAREARQKKYAATGKKEGSKRDEERERGNKPDGEFEGDGVNGDRRRTDGEETDAGGKEGEG